MAEWGLWGKTKEDQALLIKSILEKGGKVKRKSSYKHILYSINCVIRLAKLFVRVMLYLYGLYPSAFVTYILQNEKYSKCIYLLFIQRCYSAMALQ